MVPSLGDKRTRRESTPFTKVKEFFKCCTPGIYVYGIESDNLNLNTVQVYAISNVIYEPRPCQAKGATAWIAAIFIHAFPYEADPISDFLATSPSIAPTASWVC